MYKRRLIQNFEYYFYVQISVVFLFFKPLFVDTESDGGMVDMNVTKIIQKTTTRREENTVVEEQYEYYSPAFVTNP